MRNRRHKTRELALQGIYQWIVAGGSSAEIVAHSRERDESDMIDDAFLEKLTAGVIQHAPALDAVIAPHLDRAVDELSPVEHAVLLLAAFEFRDSPETPYRVVLNEAVELAKSYGGTDGHKYVNGVLDKIAAQLRGPEVSSLRGRAQ